MAETHKLIKEADPELIEEWKWRGVAVWSHDDIICNGDSNTIVVHLNFARGAALKDPGHLFNSSLEGSVRCAIDIHEGKPVDQAAFGTLARQAFALNGADKSKPKK